MSQPENEYIRLVDKFDKSKGLYPVVDGSIYLPFQDKLIPATGNLPASYIIFKDEHGIVYAKNGKTGKIDFFGDDASTVIQNAINALTPNRTWKEKVVIKGEFTLSTSLNLVPYLVLDLSDAKLILGNGVNKHVIVGVPNSTSHVEIIGGIIDGNRDNQTDLANTSGFFFEALTRDPSDTTVYYEDIIFVNTTVQNCKNSGYWLHNIKGLKMVNVDSLYNGDPATGGAPGGPSGSFGFHLQNCFGVDIFGFRSIGNVGAGGGFGGYDAYITNGLIDSDGKQATTGIPMGIDYENQDIEARTVISNVTIKGYRTGIGGIYIGVTFHNIKIYGTGTPDSYGIWSSGKKNSTLFQFLNLIISNVAHGISFDPADKATEGLIIGGKISATDPFSAPGAPAGGIVIKNVVGYSTENFKSTGLGVSIGTSGSYGSATSITSLSGIISYPRVKITWGGTFGTGETVTVKVEAVYRDGTTAYVEKSATAVGSLWLTDDDIMSLITQGKDIVRLNIYGKTNLPSTSVTVTVDAYGKA
ncbi:hypothetical protein [Candidatus Methanodesulfokora washburnensis]|uniref:Right-handed parallel beta-helix repeat-containing protein n=1 Tax=Candidatus Methanodesulfokora washburnensis TaxID=2478471 RepID=A0A3R9R1Y2_9CREN|nr:hypothetical protein [Candidatus Methanodesulfokores washburnensis]RSN72959.1 hypothetical protein D6D85_11755 [Candidatus Methanodesulfokores washburnensis]